MELFSITITLIFTFHLLVLCSAEFPKVITPDFEKFLENFNADEVDDKPIRARFPYGGKEHDGKTLKGRPWSRVFSRWYSVPPKNKGGKSERICELKDEYNNNDFIWQDDTDPNNVIARKGIVSFGGFDKEEERTEYMRKVDNKRPVILLHGISHGAEQMGRIAKYLKDNSYGWHEIYAFTWGPEDKGPEKKEGKMDCDAVKQVRIFILAVLAYTGATAVNIVGLSTGVLLGRKAVLGGECVDEKVVVEVAGRSEEHKFNLGEKLTSKILTFIGVSGPNHGSLVCKVMGKMPLLNFLKNYQSCNTLNGFHPDSEYLVDINKFYETNKETNYEGKHVFSIITPIDKRVYFHYQTQRGAFANGCLIKDEEKIDVNGHVAVLYKSKELILRMLQHPAEATQICQNGGTINQSVVIKNDTTPSLEEPKGVAPKKSGKPKIDPVHLIVKAYYAIPRLAHPEKFEETPAAKQTTSDTILAALRSFKESLTPEIPAVIG